MPGCRLPILLVEELMNDQPDDLLILAWNFAEEIVAQQRDFSTFYVPVPVLHAIEA